MNQFAILTLSSPPKKTSRKKSVAAALALSGFVVACDGADSELSELAGVWQSRGYGLIAEIDADKVTFTEKSPTACLPSESNNANRFLQRLKTEITPDVRTIALGSNGTLSTVVFDRLDAQDLDDLCQNGRAYRSSDPMTNFEVFWQTFDEHYAFFAERNVDWHTVYADLHSQINEATSEHHLSQLLGQTLEELGDAHVGLYVDGDDLVYVPSRLENRLRQECQAMGCDPYEEWEKREESNGDIVTLNYLNGAAEFGLRGYAQWGQIDPETGYFRIDSMSGLSDDGHSASDDIRAIHQVLDSVMADLGSLPTMIIDVRYNGGGYDAVSVAIASRFTEERLIFGSKRAYISGDATKPQDLVVEPANDGRYDGRVAVLISGQTASAAEIFAMAMRAMPHATLVGEPTEGILSDELYRTMPNGWEISLSNEIYLTHDGELFEVTGVPPDVSATFLDKEQLGKSVDSGIEAALRTFARSS